MDRGEAIYNWIKAQHAEGRTVYATTYLKSTKIAPKHAELVRYRNGHCEIAKLEPWEVVHHKDGNPRNNELSNLEVIEFGEHTRHHHNGSRRDEDAKRSFIAFAQMREELKRARDLNAEMAELLRAFVDRHGAYIEALPGGRGMTDLKKARALLARITNPSP